MSEEQDTINKLVEHYLNERYFLTSKKVIFGLLTAAGLATIAGAFATVTSVMNSTAAKLAEGEIASMRQKARENLDYIGQKRTELDAKFVGSAFEKQLTDVKGQQLHHAKFGAAFRTGPENIGPEQNWRFRVVVGDGPQALKVGTIPGEFVAAWVDWTGHPKEQVNYLNVAPKAEGRDIILELRAATDTVVSISSIEVHVLYRVP